ncbi:hypothetical protein C1637_09020 [Chryseobacterium lactis]|uniref:Bacteriocin n=1 Tax=Chryseobacterium lactis TaxID=1241981 RepID=A0AA92BDA3_CHRLC|nr:hypothetical protein [Chryseobacterium lactis]PNW13995.1 hypothetical protein C1637_09020 [Chryseobacterium lactis]
MKNLKRLSRNDLKIIAGGSVADDEITSDESGAGYYKCCSNNSDSCSSCVKIKTKPVCSTGSYPVAC